MDETKVQIGEDVVLDIGTHSDWYISAVCYNGESVNVDLRRKADWHKDRQKHRAKRLQSSLPKDGTGG